MEPSSNPYDELEPLFNGLPAIVRLLTNEDILCVLFQRREHPDEIDTRMFLERPLRAVTIDAGPASGSFAAKQTQTVYSTIQTRFERWMPFTSAVMFPVYADHILSIAPLAEQYINPYMSWAEELYQRSGHSTVDTSAGFADQTEEDIRRSYIDYLLHQFNPKGKPN